MVVHVRLGNSAPVAVSVDPETGKQIRTPVEIADHEVAEMRLHESDLRSTLATASALWASISDAPPLWLEADDEMVGEMLASQFGCQRGEPAKPKKGGK